MSAFRGILTGFGMAAIKDKEAKDNLLKDIRKKYQARLDAASTDLPF